MHDASHQGRLLVATPSLLDPNFERTVVLLLDHDPDGALGIVLNRPTPRPVETVLDGWGGLVAEPSLLFTGGPVEQLAVVGLAVGRAGVLVPDRAIAGRIRAVDLTADPDEVATEVEQVRVFSGYAGWSPGQLEEELEQGAWIALDATDQDVVSTDPEQLWRTVLARQQGLLRALADFPDDPRLN